MAIDPLIANPATVKFADPLEQYHNFLQSQYLQSEIQKAQRTENDDTASNNVYKNVLAQTGLNEAGQRQAIMSGFAAGNVGKLIPGVQAKWAELDKAKAATVKDTADASKAWNESVGKALDNSQKSIASIDANDPTVGQPQMYAHIVQDSKDPTISKMNMDRGVTPDQYVQQEIAKMKQFAVSPQAWNQYMSQQQMGVEKARQDLLQRSENIVHVADRGGNGQTVLAVNKYGTPAVNNLETLSSTSKAPNVSVTVEKDTADAYGKKSGELAAERDAKLQDIADAAPQYVAAIDRAKALAASGKVITGAAADAKLNGLRALSAAGQHGYDDVINSTQEYDKILSGILLDQAVARNKAGLGSRTTVQELNMLRDASARRDMGLGAQMTILDNLRKDYVENAPKFNRRLQSANTSPELGVVNKTLVTNPVTPIPTQQGNVTDHRTVAEKYGF